MQRAVLTACLLLLAAASSRSEPADAPGRGPDELLAEARKAYYEAEDAAAAEALYRAAAFHSGVTWAWDGTDFDALAASIGKHAPENVLFVVSPKVLDVNLHRRILMDSAKVDAGATAFLCPLGANHGMAVSREVAFALGNGASLGETVKSTYDDLHLASRGELVLDIQVDGEPHQQREYVMQGGGANRVLIGDPALSPFEATPHPMEEIAIQKKTDSGFEVVVTWEEGFHAPGWDMYGQDRQRDWTIRTRVVGRPYAAFGG